MSSFMRLFGSAPPKPVGPTPQEAIDKLKDASRTLEQRNAFLETKIQKETKTAREAQRKNVPAEAILALKRRKLHQNEFSQNCGIIGNLEAQIASIEAAAGHLVALAAMQTGTQTMAQMNREADIDRVEDVLDQVTEQMQLFEDFSQVISTPMSSALDSTDWEAELEALGEEDTEQDDELARLEVPTQKGKVAPVRAKPVTEEDQFEALSAQMGL